LTDYLTRFCWLVPVPDTKAETVAQALISTWFGVFGPPDSIISDQGHDNKEFGNELLQAVYDLMGVTKMSTVGIDLRLLESRRDSTVQ
jgi:hypothetical protein